MKTKLRYTVLFFFSYFLNAQNLVAYYRFNGNANDESGNSNHGTVSGATLTSDRFDNANSAYNFDGNDVINIPHTAILNASNELTFSVWINPTSFPSSGSFMVLGKSNYSSNTNYLLRIKPGGFIQFEYKDFANTNGNPLILNQWNHIAVVSDVNNIKKVYVNSVLIIHTGGASPYGLVTNPLTIGAASYGSEYFKGAIDDLRIYQSALSSFEISSLFTNNTLNIQQEKPFETNTFYVYKNTLYLKIYQNLSEIKLIEVYNASGKKVFKTTTITNEISFGNLPNGVYILKVDPQNKNHSTLKFLIKK